MNKYIKLLILLNFYTISDFLFARDKPTDEHVAFAINGPEKDEFTDEDLLKASDESVAFAIKDLPKSVWRVIKGKDYLIDVAEKLKNNNYNIRSYFENGCVDKHRIETAIEVIAAQAYPDSEAETAKIIKKGQEDMAACYEQSKNYRAFLQQYNLCNTKSGAEFLNYIAKKTFKP